MSNKDYTKFSKNHNRGDDNINHVSAPEVAYPLPEDDIAEVPTDVSEHVEQKPVTLGKVVDCSKLNVRQYPTLHADVLCCLVEDSVIEIDEAKSTNEFYAVCTPTGLEGFCLKKFVEVCK